MRITESSALPLVDQVALGKILGDDAALGRHSLLSCLVKIDGDIAALGNLAASGAREPILAIAHRLKRACSNAQAPGLKNALQLERQCPEQYVAEEGF